MAAPSQLATVYCTDEDIAIRAYGDFAVLVPASQILAQGTDGVFANGAGWVLTSATVNFQNQGVAVGHIVQLTAPAVNFKGAGQIFAVGAVSGSSLTLRRIGKGDGIGQPPSPTAGLSGVSFAIKTFDPQIEDACYQINTQYGIDPNFALISPDLIYDLRVLRQATVLTVLKRAYQMDTRTKDGDFPRKIAEITQELSDTMSIIQVRWNPQGSDPPPTVRYMRLTR